MARHCHAPNVLPLGCAQVAKIIGHGINVFVNRQLIYNLPGWLACLRARAVLAGRAGTAPKLPAAALPKLLRCMWLHLLRSSSPMPA